MRMTRINQEREPRRTDSRYDWYEQENERFEALDPLTYQQQVALVSERMGL